ncbi:MFS transporter [Thermosynechococcus sp. JY1334]|uniref:MFS transporter n=1 Tax=unclassified Thermosynechococcus TaxID=2622553 RepID=UPI002673C770|nr:MULTISPECIES: MFS transporter [unclassified Thermosynechococcus]MDR7898124.1 MFS transporter [Thermosynechococcus sp. JY1332]MDR7905525.1 MFS transporter [Thermosynechococcus sp. JY1334]WKT85255.1 MFS transporter [Thermosynechococcus sp. JY1339]WNC54198.1 MFS transporter [Thermosynechococcus sp. JY1331]
MTIEQQDIRIDLPLPPVPPLWQNRNFIALWLAQVCSQLADKIYLVFVIALTTEFFQAADQSISGWVSAIMVAFTIPAILLGSVAGVLVDRWSKKQVLIVTNLYRALLVLGIPITILLGAGQWFGFMALLLITFTISCLTQFFAPAEQAAIPLLVDKSHLLSANSLYTLTMMAALVVGFAAGEPLLNLASHWHSQWGGAVFVSACYGGAALLLMLLRPPDQCHLPPSRYRQVWQELRQGLQLLQEYTALRFALLQLILLFAIVAAMSVLVVRLAEVLPSLDTDQFGFLLAAAAGGLGLGALLLNTVGKHFAYGWSSLLGCWGMGGMFLGLSLSLDSLAWSMGYIIGLGFFAALVAIPMQTLIQLMTPAEQRGAIFGLQNNLVNIALSVPLAVVGLAETWWGLQPVLIGLGGAIALGGTLMTLNHRNGMVTGGLL